MKKGVYFSYTPASAAGRDVLQKRSVHRTREGSIILALKSGERQEVPVLGEERHLARLFRGC
jgi:hypothetical protein